MKPADGANTSTRIGRRPSTTPAELSHVALRLFAERGFETTTVDDIAAAAGIGRTTFFRYFNSKNDLPWGDFEAQLERMREYLRTRPGDLPLMDALRLSVLEFNRVPEDEIPYHRERMRLLLTVPALMAHSTLRYEAWRDVVADFVAQRLGVPRTSSAPSTVAWTLMGAALSAYEQWLQHEDTDLIELLDASLRLLNSGFADLE
ncbi:MAG: mycofactocin system transcriptional regulator [Actinomycetota bacterium]